MNATRISTVHRIGTGSKRFTLTPAIRCVTSVLAIDHVGSNGQDRLRVQRVAIGWVFSEFPHKGTHDPGREMVYAIVVVAEFRKFAFRLVIDNQSGLVSDHLHLCVTDGRQTVSHD